MSLSILQNSYAILLAYTTDMDRHLLAREQLLIWLSEIRAQEIARDEGVVSRNTDK